MQYINTLLAIGLYIIWQRRDEIDEWAEAFCDRLLCVPARTTVAPHVAEKRRDAIYNGAAKTLHAVILPLAVTLTFLHVFVLEDDTVFISYTLVPNLYPIFLIARVVWVSWAFCGTKARLLNVHRILAVGMALAIKARLFRFPAGYSNNNALWALLMRPIFMNTIIAAISCESLAEFIVFRLGIFAVCMLGVADTGSVASVLQGLSSRQVAVLVSAACVAPVVHQCACALQRRLVFASTSSASETNGDNEATFWMRCKTLMSAVAIVLPMALMMRDYEDVGDKLKDKFECVARQLRNTLPNGSDACGLHDLAHFHELPAVKALWLACVLSLITWRCYEDKQRNKGHVSQGVETRRKRAMSILVMYVLLGVAVRMLFKRLFGDNNGNPGPFTLVRFAFMILCISCSNNYRSLITFVWVMVAAVSLRCFVSVGLPNTNGTNPTVVARLLGIHVGLIFLRESRISYFVHSLIICSSALWAVGFDEDYVRICIAIVGICIVLFFTKMDHIAVFDREAEAKEAAKALAGAEAAAKHEKAATKEALDAASEARTALADEKEAVKEVEAAARDVEDHLQGCLENAVEESETLHYGLELYAAAIDVAGKGIIIYNAQQEVLMVNETWVQVTGYAKEETIGKKGGSKFLQGPKTADTSIAAMRRAIRNGTRFSGVIINYKQSGEYVDDCSIMCIIKRRRCPDFHLHTSRVLSSREFWNEVTINPVQANGRIEQYIGTVDDVTQRVSAEKAQKRAEADAAAAEAAREAQALTEHNVSIFLPVIKMICG